MTLEQEITEYILDLDLQNVDEFRDKNSPTIMDMLLGEWHGKPKTIKLYSWKRYNYKKNIWNSGTIRISWRNINNMIKAAPAIECATSQYKYIRDCKYFYKEIEIRQKQIEVTGRLGSQEHS